ncbi:MAG: tetratricopeptide repeat protein, partial [Pirellulales bacterium]
SPPLDEHGFPVPPTFDDPVSPGPGSHALLIVFRAGLVLAFVGLLLALLYRLPLRGAVNDWLAPKPLKAARQKQAQGDVQGALAEVDRAALLLPNDPRVYDLRARLKLEANDVEGGLEDFNKLVQLTPREPYAYVGRSVAYRRLERHHEAIEDLTKAIALSPNDTALYDFRARLKLEVGDVEGGLEDYNELVRRAPREANVYVARSFAYQRLRRHREAIDDLTKAVALSDGSLPRNNRAYARAQAGIELHEAMIDVEQALVMNKQELQQAEQSGLGAPPAERLIAAHLKVWKAAYLDTRGYLFFLQQNYESALADLDEAIELAIQAQTIVLPLTPLAERAEYARQLDHNLSVMHYHRGQTLEKLGHEREAKSDLYRARQLGYNPALGVF